MASPAIKGSACMWKNGTVSSISTSFFQGFSERVFFHETFSILFPAKFLDRVSCVVSLCVRRGGVDGELSQSEERRDVSFTPSHIQEITVCTWLREISSCFCLTFLPGPALVLLSKTNKPLFPPLYTYTEYSTGFCIPAVSGRKESSRNLA